MSQPPSAGPEIDASSNEVDSHALTLANCSGRRSWGRRVDTDGEANARAAPTRMRSR